MSSPRRNEQEDAEQMLRDMIYNASGPHPGFEEPPPPAIQEGDDAENVVRQYLVSDPDGDDDDDNDGSDDDNSERDPDAEPEEEDDDEEEEEQQANVAQPSGSRKRKRNRGSKKKMVGRTEIEDVADDGTPMPAKVKTQLVNQIGYLVRENIPIKYKLWKKTKKDYAEEDIVPESEKNMIWDQVKTHFGIPPCERKEANLRKWTLQKMALAFQNFKKKLTREYLKKGRTPNFEDTYYKNQRQFWSQFVQAKMSEDSAQRTATNTENARNKVHFHTLGPGGYSYHIPKWDAMEAELIARGIVPQTLHWPRRVKWYFYGHGGRINMENGRFITSDQIAEATARLDQILKEVEEGKFVPNREKDELTAALGNPEHTGRTRGMGVVPWKHGFSGDLDTYRSRCRSKAVVEEKFRQLERELEERRRKDNAEMSEELNAKLAQEVNKALALAISEGRLVSTDQNIQASPPSQHRSSVASTELGGQPNTMVVTTGRHPVDDITVRTKCELLYPVGSRLKVCALGVAEVPVAGETIHSMPVPEGYARVEVDQVKELFEDVELYFPTSEGGNELRDALHTWTCWPKQHIRLIQATQNSPSSAQHSRARSPTPGTAGKSRSPTPAAKGITSPTPPAGGIRSPSPAAVDDDTGAMHHDLPPPSPTPSPPTSPAPKEPSVSAEEQAPPPPPPKKAKLSRKGSSGPPPPPQKAKQAKKKKEKPPPEKLACDMTPEELRAHTKEEVKNWLDGVKEGMKPPPKIPVDPVGKAHFIKECMPVQKERETDYNRSIRKSYSDPDNRISSGASAKSGKDAKSGKEAQSGKDAKSGKEAQSGKGAKSEKSAKSGKDVPQLGQQAKQSIEPLIVLSKEAKEAMVMAEFVAVTGMTKEQLEGTEELPPENNNNQPLKKAYVHGQALIWDELVPFLPTRMRQLHDWYMEQCKNDIIGFAVRCLDEHYFRGADDIWVEFENLHDLYHQDALDKAIISSFCL